MTDQVSPAQQPEQTAAPEQGLILAPARGQDIAIIRAPQRVLEEARLAALALQDVISKKKKPVIMNGEQYLEFEDWQTLGRFYGVTAKVRRTAPIELGTAMGFEATAEAVRADGMVISAADAMCMNDEEKWGMRPKYKWENGDRVQVGETATPLYQLRSMAQTRACAKALRNVLAWVVVLAGYGATPAEEMAGVETRDENEPACPECGKVGFIIKGKPEYGGGFLCYKKKGGCGYKFQEFVKPQKDETDQEFDQRTEPQQRIAIFQIQAFDEACKRTGKSEDEIKAFLSLIGEARIEHIKKTDFNQAIKWANTTGKTIPESRKDKATKAVAEIGGKVVAASLLEPSDAGKAMKRLFALANELNIPETDVKRASYEKFKVDSMTKLTAAQLDEMRIWVKDVAEAING